MASEPVKTGWLLAGLAILFVALLQSRYMIGTWSGWPQYTDDYRRLTDGFLHGQLSLSTGPPPALLALSDPYDPALNKGLRLHDALLFNGRYYFFWGPAPALLAAAICGPLGIAHPRFGDQALVFIFMAGTTLVAAVLILLARARFFGQRRLGPGMAAILSLGAGTPALFTLARPAVYEAAISAGQFFLLTGLVIAWQAIGSVRLRTALLAGASICWTMAWGSRLSLAPAIFTMTAFTAWYVWKTTPSGEKRSALPGLLAMATPLAIGLVLIGWYNFRRFGSIAEFGLRYQLAGLNLHDLPSGLFSSTRYLIPNFLLYLFMPPHFSTRFPFIFALGPHPMIQRLLHPASFHRFEAFVGLAWSQPFLFLAPLSVLGLRWRTARIDELGWLTGSLLIAATVGFLPVLFLYLSTMRWLMDAVPCLTILAAIGCWRVWDRPPRWAQWLMGVGIAYEIAFGILLSLTAYYAHFSDSLPAIPGGFDWLTHR